MTNTDRLVFISLAALRILENSPNPNSLKAPGVIGIPSGENYAVMTAHDLPAEPKICIKFSDPEDRLIPRSFRGSESKIINRMCAFVERMRSPQKIVPDSWSPHWEGDLVSFNICSGSTHIGQRWVCQVTSGKTPIVIFHTIATNSLRLENADFISPPLAQLENTWENFRQKFAEIYAQITSDAKEFSLLPAFSPYKEPKSYNLWLNLLTREQLQFLNPRPDKSLRLYGPAGSGKSLALALRAFKLANEWPEKPSPKILVISHSWATAAMIDSVISGCGAGALPNVDVFPLMDLIQEVLPNEYLKYNGFELIDVDSSRAVVSQLNTIVDILEDFVATDWITYSRDCSSGFQARMNDSTSAARIGLAWDLKTEFGSVLGAARILPSRGAFRKYSQLARGPWMMKMDETKKDREVVYDLYKIYLQDLHHRSIITPDQVFADALSFLETNIWAKQRDTQGYDAILVDEFHLFSPLERLVMQGLIRDPEEYPTICMASDPAQSAAMYFALLGSEGSTAEFDGGMDDDLFEDTPELVELDTVHRYPQSVLNFLTHIEADYPIMDFIKPLRRQNTVQASRQVEKIPEVTYAGNEPGWVGGVDEILDGLPSDGTKAVICLTESGWSEYADTVVGSGYGKKLRPIAGRDEIEGLQYTPGIIPVISSDNSAGLEFDHVVVTGFPGKGTLVAPSNMAVYISRLYVAASRCVETLTLYVDKMEPGLLETLEKACEKNVLIEIRRH